MAPAQWEKIRDRKLEEQRSRIPQEWLIPASQLPSTDVSYVMDIPGSCGILSNREIKITEGYNARSLAAAIREKEYNAVEVTTAFCKRAAIANQLTSCLTEPLFAPVLARARFLDTHLHRTGQTLGPLHGLPISIKDTFNIEGVDSTVGISALAFHTANANAPIVNNIFGRVLNPRNRQQWTAGGSSGGEAILVAMRGSVMGVGTDVGGSIRIPAFVNGIVGFKPGKGRISTKGLATAQLPAAGKVGLEFCAGPIARTTEDIGLFMEVVESGRMWEVDPEVKAEEGWWTQNQDALKIPKKLQDKTLRIGILSSDGITTPLPSITTMLHTLTRTLNAHSIATIPINPFTTSFSAAQSLTNKFFSVSGSTHLLSLLNSTSEPLIPWLSSRLKPRPPATLDHFRSLLAQREEL
ncbi:MAG: hypothetical protein Q9213_007375, partial [Squamulea squamosa]